MFVVLWDWPCRSWRSCQKSCAHLRKLLDGQLTGHVGLDELIVVEAIATALAYQTQRTVSKPPEMAHHSLQQEEFAALFELIQQMDPWTFSSRYVTACVRIGTVVDH
jgi:hypothetical protein